MKNEPSRTSGVEKCNNWNENFTRRIWYQIWTNRIKKNSGLEKKSIEIIQPKEQRGKKNEEK